LPERGIHRILVCRPNHRLGNMMLLAPLLSELEALYPGAEVDIFGGQAAACLYGSHAQVFRVFQVPRRIARHLLATLRLLRQMRGVRYDLAIDACLGSQSGRLVLALARARYKLGFPGATTRPSSAWHKLTLPPHHAHRNVFMLRAAYRGGTRGACPPLEVRLQQDEISQAGAMLRKLCDGAPVPRGPVVGIFTNATGAKRLPETWWQEFLDCFQRLSPGAQVIDVVAAHGQSQLGDRFPSFYTRNLRSLAAVVASMQGFISGDCGVMHLAAASGTPTLGLFQTTDPANYAPYGRGSTGIIADGMTPSVAAETAAQWFQEVLDTSDSGSAPQGAAQVAALS